MIEIERTVYVDRLDKRWNHDDVRHLFEKCGEIDYVSLPRDRVTKAFKGFGFIEFHNSMIANRGC